MDMMKIQFQSLLMSAKAIKENIRRLSQHRGKAYIIVTERSIELLIEEMEEFEEKYIEENGND